MDLGAFDFETKGKEDNVKARSHQNEEKKKKWVVSSAKRYLSRHPKSRLSAVWLLPVEVLKLRKRL